MQELYQVQNYATNKKADMQVKKNPANLWGNVHLWIAETAPRLACYF